jgi:hypothetical protein
MKNIFFIGDSNVMYYNAAVTKDGIVKLEKEIQEVIRQEALGKFVRCIDNNIVHYNGMLLHLSWRSHYLASNVSKDFLQKAIDEFNAHLNEGDVAVFQFGRVDLTINNFSNMPIEDVVDNYVREVSEFSANNNLIPFICTPIAHQSVASKENIDRFTEMLNVFCKKYKIAQPIHLFNVIDYNFDSETWDDWNHLNTTDSIKTLNYIFDSINNSDIAYALLDNE